MTYMLFCKFTLFDTVRDVFLAKGKSHSRNSGILEKKNEIIQITELFPNLSERKKKQGIIQIIPSYNPYIKVGISSPSNLWPMTQNHKIGAFAWLL